MPIVTRYITICCALVLCISCSTNKLSVYDKRAKKDLKAMLGIICEYASTELEAQQHPGNRLTTERLAELQSQMSRLERELKKKYHGKREPSEKLMKWVKEEMQKCPALRSIIGERGHFVEPPSIQEEIVPPPPMEDIQTVPSSPRIRRLPPPPREERLPPPRH